MVGTVRDCTLTVLQQLLIHCLLCYLWSNCEFQLEWPHFVMTTMEQYDKDHRHTACKT